jgi:hypothetical protein
VSVSGYKKFAFTVFERTFKEVGLPRVIRTANGVPFASAHAIYGLSKVRVVAPARHPDRTDQTRAPVRNSRAQQASTCIS